jgi:hypothetical protein
MPPPQETVGVLGNDLTSALATDRKSNCGMEGSGRMSREASAQRWMDIHRNGRLRRCTSTQCSMARPHHGRLQRVHSSNELQHDGQRMRAQRHRTWSARGKLYQVLSAQYPQRESMSTSLALSVDAGRVAQPSIASWRLLADCSAKRDSRQPGEPPIGHCAAGTKNRTFCATPAWMSNGPRRAH